jgi:hypothetical protein
VSSLATVAAVELVRGRRSARGTAAGAGLPEAGAREVPRVAEPLVEVPREAEAPAVDDERWAELERRVAALELRSSARTSAAPGAAELAADEALRERVLAWVEAEREARARDAAASGEEHRRAELEFSARYEAMTMAQEHGLAPWQEEELAELFLETGIRADEIEGASTSRESHRTRSRRAGPSSTPGSTSASGR